MCELNRNNDNCIKKVLVHCNHDPSFVIDFGKFGKDHLIMHEWPQPTCADFMAVTCRLFMLFFFLFLSFFSERSLLYESLHCNWLLFS